MSLRFTWDSAKAAANLRKHGVSFIEALLMGLSDRERLLVVVHVERGDLIRIISARLASRRERKTYEEEA